jgi:hypothetical protein
METKYVTENMGEVTIDDGFAITIWGKYNSKDILIALVQLLDFSKNKDFIMNIVNQYDKIHRITKMAIMEDINCKESIKDYFMHTLYEEKLSKLFSMKEFDINKILRNTEEPRLYFEGGLGEYIKDFSVQYWFSNEFPDTVLHIIMDENLNIIDFMLE